MRKAFRTRSSVGLLAVAFGASSAVTAFVVLAPEGIGASVRPTSSINIVARLDSSTTSGAFNVSNLNTKKHTFEFKQLDYSTGNYVETVVSYGSKTHYVYGKASSLKNGSHITVTGIENASLTTFKAQFITYVK